MEAGLEHLQISPERLVNPQLAGGDLIDWAGAAATHARAPYLQAPKEIATTLQARLIAGAFEFLALEVLEIFIVAFLNRLVMRLGHVIYIMLLIGRAYYLLV